MAKIKSNKLNQIPHYNEFKKQQDEKEEAAKSASPSKKKPAAQPSKTETKKATVKKDKLASIPNYSSNRQTMKPRTTGYLDAARNATKPTISTGTGNYSSRERLERRQQLEAELKELEDRRRLNQQKQAGYMRGHATALLSEAEKEANDIYTRISEINKELDWLDQPNTISYNDQLSNNLAAAKDRQQKAQNAVAKYSGEAGGRALAQLPEEERKALYEELNAANAAAAALEREQDQIEYLNEWQDVKLADDTFWNQFRANYRVGRITQDTNEAFNDYILNPTDANKDYAYALEELLGQYQANNEKVLDDEGAKLPWVSQTAAGYIPQFWDQTKATVGGGIVGGVVGGAMGAPVKGIEIGGSIASGIESYGQMRGATYRTLIAAGVDEETALSAANDEALVSALIEAAGSYIGFKTLGGTKALNVIGNAALKSGSKNAAVQMIAKAFGGSAADRAAKTAAAEVGKGLLRKGAEFAGGLALNAASEYAEEGLQESVSIANQNRDNTGAWNLAKEAAGVLGDAFTGKNDEAREQITSAGEEGMKIALMFGGVQSVTNNVIATYANAKSTQQRNAIVDEVLKDGKVLDALIEEGKQSGENSVSAKIATEIEQKKANGKEITRKEVEQLIVSNDVYIREEAASIAAQEAAGARQSEFSAESDKTPAYDATLARTPQNAVYGNAGMAKFRNIVETSDMSMEEVQKAFQTPYEMGYTNKLGYASEKLTGIQKEAYNAGRMDAMTDMAERKRKNPTIWESAGFDMTNAPADITSEETAFMQLMAKAYAVKGVWGESTESEAFDGKINSNAVVTFAKDFGISAEKLQEIGGVANLNKIANLAKERNKSVTFLLSHEIAVHRMLELAPEEGTAFINAMYQAKNTGRPVEMGTLAEGLQARYERSDRSITTGLAIEEITADSIIDLYGDEKSFREAMERIINGKDEKAKSGAKKFVEILKETVAKLKRMLNRLRGKENAEARKDVKDAIRENEQLIQMFEDAQRAALKNVESGKGQEYTGGEDTKHSLKEVFKNGRERTEEARRAAFQADRVLHWKETSEGRREAAERREQFKARIGQSGATLRRGEGCLYGYRVVAENRAGAYAKRAAEELRKLGAEDFFIYDGEIQWNYAGTTSGSNSYAVTLNDGGIGINNGTKITDDVAPPAELAAHEMIHRKVNAGTKEGRAFRKAVILNTKPDHPMFLRYFDLINRGYHNGALDINKVEDVAEFYREFVAYVGGFIYAGNVDVSPMFVDFGAVRGALESALGVQIEKRGEKYSVKDSEYLDAVLAGDTKKVQQMVNAAAETAMPDSKIRDKSGKLMPVYHGTNNEFYVFDTKFAGGKNGTAEGYGIYTSDNQEVTEAYGTRQLKLYANITKPAMSNKKTIKAPALAKLIKDTCNRQAMDMVAEGDYDSEKDALFDTWISNYVYTYDLGMERSYREAAAEILRMNDSDMAVIQEVMSGMGIRDYISAMNFYEESLTPITGFDGFFTQWENADTGKKSNIILAFNSSQLKSAEPVERDNGELIPLSERFNKDNQDIRYSAKDLDEIKSEYKDKTDYLFMHERGDTISIDNMVVKKEYRNKGIGTQILSDVISYADETGKTITLTPTSEFGTKARLTKWYKAHGFVANRGRNADYRLSDTMYRLPQSNTFSNPATGENVKFSLREEDPPKKTIIAYKAFYAHDGKLYPPMVSNPSDESNKVSGKVKKELSGTVSGQETPVGVWLNADVGGIGVDKDGNVLRTEKTGRIRVQNDQGGGTLAFRPGWHLGEWPDAKQFNRGPLVPYTNYKGEQASRRVLMPDGIVFAKCEIAADVDYQLEAMEYGMSEKVNKKGKTERSFSRSQAGLPRVPEDGYYKYRTNVDPTTAPWYITGAMRVVEILDDDDCARICAEFGVVPDKRVSGKKINLADYGLKRGPVTPTENVERFKKSQRNIDNEALLEKALSDPEYADAYKPGVLDFDNPEIRKEFEINKQDAEYYRKEYEKRDKKFSLKDSTGAELTKEQAEYFKDSQIRDDEGNLRRVYHGTNTGDFTVFDWKHTQRADGGWFGRGHYFAFYKGEAQMYGRRVIDAYLNIKNPFVFDEQLMQFEGQKPDNVQADSLVFMINFAEKFPELAEKRTLTVVTGWDDQGYGTIKKIPWSDLRSEIDNVLNDKSFKVIEITDPYEGDYFTHIMQNGPGKYDYAYGTVRYKTREEAEAHRFDSAVEMLVRNIYKHAELNMPHYYIEDIGSEFTEALKKRGYDGVLQTRHGDEVVAFYSEQIKRADNKNPTGDPDIRFSLKDQDKLLQENERLKEVNQELQEQFKTTKFAQVDKKSLDAFAKKLLKDYQSGADIDETRDALNELYTYIANGENGESPVWQEAYKRAYDTAVEILEQSSDVDDHMYREYKALRDEMRTRGLYLAKEYTHDLAGYESINEFRQAHFGSIKMTNDGIPVGIAYSDLASRYPEFFDEYEHTNPADQLLHIAEVLDSLKPVEVNRYAYNMRESATWLANDIMERFFELPQAKPTFADKAQQKLTKQVIHDAKKLERLREEKNERIAKLIKREKERTADIRKTERDKRSKAVKQVKEYYLGKQAAGSERRNSAVLRKRITKHASELSKKLLSPTDNQHIPESLRTTVAAVLEAINLESQFTIDPVTGKRTKNGGGDPVKRTEAFRKLKAAYSKILQQEGNDMVIDPSLLGNAEEGFDGYFDIVLGMSDTKLADMSLDQLEIMWRVIRAVERSVSTAGKLLASKKFERTLEWAEAFENDTETRRRLKGSKIEKFLLDLENPYTFFAHYGEAGNAVFRMLRDAQDAQQDMVEEVNAAVRKIVDPKQVKAWEKEVHEFKTERGEKLMLTAAHMMEIHELMKQEDGRRHLTAGGIVQPEIKSKKIHRGTDSILLSLEDIMKIVGKLTKEQMDVADKLQALMAGTLAKYGNEASMRAYGYEKFTGTDYWPIKSAREGIHSNIEKGGSNTRSIKNIGMAKNRNPQANNALDIGGIFKTFSSHAADMTDYAAWLCPMEDANRLYNFKFRDEMGQQSGMTMKGLLDRYGGNGAQKYWHNLMEDIQNGISASNDTAIMEGINKAIGNARAASVGANIRVIVQQPTAVIRAAAVLSPVDMAKGLAGGVTRGSGWKKALKYSDIAKRKDMGGFDISSPAQMNEILFDSKTGLQKFNEAMMWGAGKADAVTWGKIWNACEWAVKDKNLETGSEEFYEEVAALFAEVVDQSQVVDGVLQRSQMMRSSNALVKQATAFMGEPTMAMNMMLRAYDGLRNEQDTKKRGKAIKAFGRAALVLLITNVVNAAAQSLVDAIRDDEDEEYWKKFKAAFTGVTGEEETLWEKATAAVLSGNAGSSLNPVGYIPFAKDLLSILQGYNVTRADADILADIVSAFQTFTDSMSGDGKKTKSNAIYNLAKQVGKVFGVSAPNITRDIYGMLRTIALETGNIPAQYELEKWIYEVSSEKNANRFVDILYKAYTEDQEVYQHIYDDMKAGGFNMEKIQNRMESNMKRDQGVTKVGDLEQRYLHPDQQTEYDNEMSSIQRSGLWGKANEDQRKDLESDLYDLIVQNESGEKLAEKIDDGRGFGLDETEYLLYQLALEIVDTPNESGKLGGAPTSVEKAAAIEAIGNLGDREIAYLWDTEQALEALASGIDMEVYAEFKAFESVTGADKKPNGKTISGSKKRKIKNWLNENNVGQEAYNYFMHEVMGYK